MTFRFAGICGYVVMWLFIVKTVQDTKVYFLDKIMSPLFLKLSLPKYTFEV